MKIIRSITTNWRKFWKGIDLDENFQITSTTLARYSLAVEIQMNIPKPFEKYYSSFLKKKTCHFCLLYLHSRNHAECRILCQHFQRPPPSQTCSRRDMANWKIAEMALKLITHTRMYFFMMECNTKWIMPFVSSHWRVLKNGDSPLFGATGNFNHQILPYGILFLTCINI